MISKKIVVVVTVILLTVAFAEAGHPNKNSGNNEMKEPCSISFFAEYDPVIADMIQGINESIVETYIQTLQDFGPRVTGSAASTAASEYIFTQFSTMNLSVSYDYWTSGGYSDRNVEAILTGTNTSSDKIYVVCGHFDSVSSSPGADDNGGGTAAVLAAAQMMSEYEFEHTIKFVAFSGEEQGLLGSYHYAGESSSQGDNIIGALNADMIGYTQTPSGGVNVKIYENSASEWITDLAINISSVYQSEIGLTINRLGGSANSDHYPFWANGYDAIFYHEYEFNPYYHSSNDIIDHMNLTYDSTVTRLIVATLAELAVPAGQTELTHKVPVYQGWNLITIPLENTWTAEKLGENITDCSVVTMMYGNNETFVSHVVGSPHDDFPILDGVGYFIYLTQDSYLNVTGLPIASVSVPIYTGWDMIGWYHGDVTTAESLGENITDCNVVTMFNGTTQTFLSHVVGTPHDNFLVTQGMGLFIYATSDSEWIGEG